MNKPKLSKEKQEKILLDYIDIPYFRNNPTYIEQWRNYYYQENDPQILFLMYHKQISTHYHWIYIELSSFFQRLNKIEISHFILSEALISKVYDETKIKDALSRLPSYERIYTKGDLLAALNQKNIQVLGRLWNSYEDEHFYKKFLDSQYPTFEIMSIVHNEMSTSVYKVEHDVSESLQNENEQSSHENLSKRNSLVINDDDGSSRASNNNDINKNIFAEPNYFELNQDEDEINSSVLSQTIELKNYDPAPPSILTKELEIDVDKNKNLIDIQELETRDNLDGLIYNSKENLESINKVKRADNAKMQKAVDLSENIGKRHRIMDNGAFSKLFDGGFHEIHGSLETGCEILINKCIYLIRSVDEDSYSLLRIAKDSDITQTMIGKYFILKPTNRDNAILAKSIFNHSCCELENQTFVLFEHSSILHLSSIIMYINRNVGFFYLKLILQCILNLIENDVLITDPVDFLVDSEFNILLNSFNFVHLSAEAMEILQNKLKDTFNNPEIEISYDYLQSIDKILSDGGCKKEVLKHKTNILESI